MAGDIPTSMMFWNDVYGWYERDPDLDLIKPIEPHYYWPSTKHMGDCQVCGNTEDHPIHPRWTQEELDEARVKAEKMSARLFELAR